MKISARTIATSVLATFVYSSVNAAEIKMVIGHVENLECSTPSSVVLEKARNEALKELGDATQYQQVAQWHEYPFYLNLDGNYSMENSDQCASRTGVATASFVEKKTMHEDWYLNVEMSDCAPHLNLFEEESWARALESATEYANPNCGGKIDSLVSVERIGVTYDPDFNETCYEIKARFKCVKP